jgi:hypothetical protein
MSEVINRAERMQADNLLMACPAEVLPGVLCVREVQRDFEDLMKVAD